LDLHLQFSCVSAKYLTPDNSFSQTNQGLRCWNSSIWLVEHMEEKFG